jgi:tetratricopeptide (TPR) repeat protein
MKRFQIVALVAGLAYAAFLLLYCVSDAFHAGLPTEMGGLVLKLDPQTLALHQVWLLSARSAVALKLASPEVTINALSALFAGLGLCGFLVVFRKLLICGMSRVDVSTLFLVQGNDDSDQPLPQEGNAHEAMALIFGEFTRRDRMALAMGTLGAGLVYAFSAPFWITATRAGPAAFDVLLLLVAVWQTTSFCLRPSLVRACVVSAVAGIGIAESPVFVVVAGVLIFFYVRSIIHFELPFQRYFLAAIGSAGLGFAVQLGLASLLFRESLGTAIPVTQVVRALVAGHLAALNVSFSPHGMWTMLWAGISFVLALCLSLSHQRENRLGSAALLTLGTGSLSVVLLNFPYMPGADWRGRGDVSVIAALAIVFATGYFMSRWFLMATVRRPGGGDAGDDSVPDVLDQEGIFGWYLVRVYGACGLVLTVALAVIQPGLNWSAVNPLHTQEYTVKEGSLTDPDKSGTVRPDAFIIDASADAAAMEVSAMRLLDQGRAGEVEQIILPHLARLRPALDRDRMGLLRARVLLARGGRNLDSARILFLHLLPRGLPEQDRIGDWMLEVGIAKQDWVMVERDSLTILKRNPLHVRANEWLGRALLKRSSLRMAVIHLSQTLTFVTNGPILTAMGEAYLRTDQADLARTALEAALLQPDVSGDAYHLLARVLVKQEQPEAVIELVRNAPEAFRSTELDLLLATTLQARGQTQASRQILDLLNMRREQLTVLQIRDLDKLRRQTADAAPKRE